MPKSGGNMRADSTRFLQKIHRERVCVQTKRGKQMVERRAVAALLRHVIAVVGLVLLCSLVASAQFDTGTIAGSVTDPSGAMVAQASVTITNVGTGIRKTLKTDSGGNFVASAVPFGNYVVSATSTGFAEVKSQHITLNVGATVHVNLTLTMAASEQT